MFQHDYSPLAVSVDLAIFTIRDQQLRLRLIRRSGEPYRGRWALPGGFVHLDESLDAAARRKLGEETGVGGAYLEQLYTFGQPERDPRGRVIAVAYYALIPTDRLRWCTAADAEAIGWFALDELPELAFDHADIIALAHQRLSAKVDYSTIAFQLMPEKFTLAELQAVYEIILRAQIDKRNFRKRILALDQLEKTGEVRRVGVHRPAQLYRVKHPGDTINFK